MPLLLLSDACVVGLSNDVQNCTPLDNLFGLLSSLLQPRPTSKGGNGATFFFEKNATSNKAVEESSGIRDLAPESANERPGAMMEAQGAHNKRTGTSGSAHERRPEAVGIASSVRGAKESLASAQEPTSPRSV